MTRPLASPRPPRSPWQLLYESVHKARWHWYSRRARKLNRPVLSVGSLLWGGAGKTPVVAAVARHLSEMGWRTTILTRGYGRQDKGVRVVSVGEGPILGPLVAGDEPVQLAGELPGVGVVVGSDRAEAGRHALERLEPTPEVFVLDDGFSHLGLFRDIDIVVFPADDPFGGGKLPPTGRLREPLSSMRRADVALLIGDDRDAARTLAEALAPFGFRGPAFSCAIEVGDARLSDGSLLTPGSRVLALAAIAYPERFLSSTREAGFEIASELLFADHHRYPDPILRRIEDRWRESGADAVLTTSKDHVKLLGRLDLPLAQLPLRALPEEPFWVWLDRRLAQQITARNSS